MKRKKIAAINDKYIPTSELSGINVLDSQIAKQEAWLKRKRSMEKKFATAKRIMVNAGKKQAKKLIKKYK